MKLYLKYLHRRYLDVERKVEKFQVFHERCLDSSPFEDECLSIGHIVGDTNWNVLFRIANCIVDYQFRVPVVAKTRRFNTIRLLSRFSNKRNENVDTVRKATWTDASAAVTNGRHWRGYSLSSGQKVTVMSQCIELDFEELLLSVTYEPAESCWKLADSAIFISNLPIA